MGVYMLVANAAIDSLIPQVFIWCKIEINFINQRGDGLTGVFQATL